jgi:hypothetical protein
MSYVMTERGNAGEGQVPMEEETEAQERQVLFQTHSHPGHTATLGTGHLILSPREGRCFGLYFTDEETQTQVTQACRSTGSWVGVALQSLWLCGVQSFLFA